MGYIRHHSIAVTSCIDELLAQAHKEASIIFGDKVSGIIRSGTNNYQSFFISPDGSKEGWDASRRGDEQRAALIAYIESLKYEDGSNSVKYCEFFFGDDEGLSKIVNHN